MILQYLKALSNQLFRFYAALPIVRELRQLNELVAELLVVQKDLLRSHLVGSEIASNEKSIAPFEHKVFSQNGEDGLLLEIFQRVGIDTKRFVEIGVGDGTENNSLLLLRLGWTGVWIEGSPQHVARIKANHKKSIERGELQLINSLATAENIATLLRDLDVDDVDLLSIDVDQNTFWIWKSLSNLRARVVVIEYNAIWPPSVDWVTPYKADKLWDGSGEFGASLKAVERLGKEMGYCLVGCDLVGVNAFLVREDLVSDHFSPPYTTEKYYRHLRKHAMLSIGKQVLSPYAAGNGNNGDFRSSDGRCVKQEEDLNARTI